MIPKTIHYCWFGGNPKPDTVLQCIESWKINCPSYDIVEWNEDNFDFSDCPYALEAYASKKWAFVSDYVRLKVLDENGGLYLDTDMEMLKPIDDLMNNCDGVLSFEARDFVCLGIIGAQKHNSLLQEFIEEYSIIHFINEDGSYDTTTNVRRFRKYLIKNGLKNNGKKQEVNDFTIFPQKFFFPNTIGMLFNRLPRKAYTIDHALASWKDCVKDAKQDKFKTYIINRARNIIGTDNVEKIREFFNIS